MNLTLRHNGELMLNPKSLEFWELLPKHANYIAISLWYSLDGVKNPGWAFFEIKPLMNKEAGAYRYRAGISLQLPLNIFHPGTWEDSLYIRPELADENTPEGTEVLQIHKYKDKVSLDKFGEYTKKYIAMKYTEYHIVIATPEMKRQYLGEGE